MHFLLNRARVASLLLAGFGGLLLGGCGGGSAATSTATTTTAAAAADETVALDTSVQSQTQALAYTVLPAELVRNGLFADGLTSWTVGDAVLVASQLRTGGKALNVGWQAVQTFGSVDVAPRKSYTLVVKARNEKTTGSTQIAVRFHRPSGYEAFRTYKMTVASNAYQDYSMDFTAPEYAAMADVTITANGTRTIIDSVSLKMRSAVVQTESIASTVGSYVPAGYVLAFNDEFNGTALNRDKWATRFIYGMETTDRLNDERQRYRDNNNQSVANGVLSLTARKVSSTDPAGINYESGMIRSLWTSRYGYYEARVKMPGGLGVWPAFWLNSDVSAEGRLAWPPEIDIFEFVNNGVEDKLNMLHSNVKTNTGVTSTLTYADPAFNPTWTYYQAPYNFNDGWHTVGAEWDATSVTMYVDGKKMYTRSYTWTYADNTLAGPAHILLNLAIGGAWAGRHGIDDSAFPQSLQIDWVRAYQKAS
jgi:beta-glucanase (GH16 family)